MDWYRTIKAMPLADNPVILRDSPDVLDMGVELGTVVSPWPRPGKEDAQDRRHRKRRRRKRRSRPDLEEGCKRPTDGTSWPRPSGTGKD
jgi:hypothetical protein